MGAVLFDLDNTLIDRAGAFREWARNFVEAHGSGEEGEVEWLIQVDNDGFEPRSAVLERARHKFGITEDASSLTWRYRLEFPQYARQMAGAAEALTMLRRSGWRIGIVTNGSQVSQTKKIEATRLLPLVDCVVISETEGISKPDPQMFLRAIERCGSEVTSNDWIVGDSVVNDIEGGLLAGLKTGWLRRGRTWSEATYRPTVIADSLTEAVHAILRG